MISSTFSAWRNDDRATPKLFAKSRSGGNFCPGMTVPSAIISLKAVIKRAVMSCLAVALGTTKC